MSSVPGRHGPVCRSGHRRSSESTRSTGSCGSADRRSGAPLLCLPRYSGPSGSPWRAGRNTWLRPRNGSVRRSGYWYGRIRACIPGCAASPDRPARSGLSRFWDCLRQSTGWLSHPRASVSDSGGARRAAGESRQCYCFLRSWRTVWNPGPRMSCQARSW